MKQIRNITCIAGLLTTPFLAQAQVSDKEDKKETKQQHFAVGIQTGSTISTSDNTTYSLPGEGIVTGPSVGLFARYYFGKHWAAEASANYTQGYPNELVSGHLGSGYYYTQHNRFARSYDIPVQLQYHFLKKDSKLRPYIGAGFGYTERKIDFSRSLLNDSGYIGQTDGTYKAHSGYFQFTQGMTYQINKHWQLNESINLQREFNSGRTSFGVKVGIAFTF